MKTHMELIKIVTELADRVKALEEMMPYEEPSIGSIYKESDEE